jgi:IclR family acetate operon transcriptional repressor
MGGAATVEKALDVLFHLHETGEPLGLSEIGRALDLPKSSCHRLLTSLLAREVVERDDRGRYRPGLALLALGLGAQRLEPVIWAARPNLEHEAEVLGETVFLVGLRHGRLRVLAKAERSGFLRAAPEVGDVVPADVTASGQLFAVLSKAGSIEGGGALPGPEIAREIESRGYAVNRDAWIEGLSVLGVPIWQGGGIDGPDLVAVLALGAASPRFDTLGEERIASRLIAAAHEVGDRLSARAHRPAGKHVSEADKA